MRCSPFISENLIELVGFKNKVICGLNTGKNFSQAFQAFLQGGPNPATMACHPAAWWMQIPCM